MTSWLILAATLPAAPSGLRVRIWRALKATHAATLREGVALLPAQAPTAAALRALEQEILAAGASAHLLELPARDAAQEAAFQALFDRREAHAGFQAELAAAAPVLARGGEVAGRRLLRQLERRLQELEAGDFFPGPSAAQSRQAWQALREQAERLWSPGEPVAVARALERLDRADFQGRRWVTRARPGIDRLATAWLILRRVDPQARFLWLADPAQAPSDALGFDHDGARFTHVGERVSFEVVAESFGLLDEPGLAALGALVRALDTGGPAPDEAPGVACLLRGLQRLHADDDALLQAALPLFDALRAGGPAPDGA